MTSAGPVSCHCAVTAADRATSAACRCSLTSSVRLASSTAVSALCALYWRYPIQVVATRLMTETTNARMLRITVVRESPLFTITVVREAPLLTGLGDGDGVGPA